MNPDARTIWQAPNWALAILLACLGMLGPFSIDTYLPAFTGIAKAIGASPVEMQQTLSAYLFGFAIMNLFHGALSDSFGRRPVVLAGLAVFTLASVGCALSQHIGALVFFRALQGMSAGAGIVVSRAVIRDMFPPADAQRVMSQVTIYFGVAPAVAPMVGGFLFVHAGWHSIFWLLTGVGVVLFALNWKLLPETLHDIAPAAVQRRQPAARLLEPGEQPALPDAGAGERHPVQRHVPLRAVDAGLPRRDPRPRAGRVLLVLRPDDRRHHGRRVPLRADGGPGQGDAPDPLRLRRSWPSVGAINLVLNLLFVPRSLVGARADRALRVRLGDDGSGRHADGARPRARAARHGVVAPGLRRQHAPTAWSPGLVAPLVMHSALALAATSLGMLRIGVVAWLWVKPHMRIAPLAAAGS